MQNKQQTVRGTGSLAFAYWRVLIVLQAYILMQNHQLQSEYVDELSN